MADDLMQSGIQSVAEVSSAGPWSPWDEKEFHFFLRCLRRNNYTWDLEVARQAWFDSMPSCNASDQAGDRRIIGDFTPNHLALVPPANGWTLVGLVHPADKHAADMNLPQSLQVIYSYYLGLDMSRV
eukprot:155748-Amphidinium_carterae.1